MELFALQILKSYTTLVDLPGNTNACENTLKAKKIMNEFSSYQLSGCFRLLIKINGLLGNVILGDTVEEKFQALSKCKTPEETVVVKDKCGEAKIKVINTKVNAENFK